MAPPADFIFILMFYKHNNNRFFSRIGQALTDFLENITSKINLKNM